MGPTGHQCSHPDSCDQRQTRQTASHDDTGCTAPDLARETLGSRARACVGGRRRVCRDQPGSYVPPLAGPLYLALALDRTTLRSRPTATQGQAGSQAQKGPRQPKLTQRLTNRATAWLSQEIPWYAGQKLKMDLVTGTALWHRDGEDPLPIRWVLLRDPTAVVRRIELTLFQFLFFPVRPFNWKRPS
jgi:hypothetical protein